MKRFLMIHFGDGWSQEHERGIYEEAIARALGEGELVSVNVFHDHAVFADPGTEFRQFDGVFIGGSSDYFFSGNTVPGRDETQEAMRVRLQPFLEAIIARGIPLLGVCFGHQILGRFLGSAVIGDPEQAEMGTFVTTCSASGRYDPLFSGAKDILTHFVHRDSLTELPEGAALLASGARSKAAAFRYGGRSTVCGFIRNSRRDHIAERMERNPSFRKTFGDILDVFAEGNPSARVLENFPRNVA